MKKKFEDAITEIAERLNQQTPQTDAEKNDLAILSAMVQQMRKDYDI